MKAAEFALVPGVVNPPFIQSAHPSTVDYNNSTACTIIQQHTACRCDHEHRLHVFEMEQMIDTHMKNM